MGECSNEFSESTEGVSLQAHVEELRRRCEAVARLQGGSTHFLEEVSIFRKYAEEQSLFILDLPKELSRPPDDEGNEHQVWFVAQHRHFLKVTWPDFFGMLVLHRTDEEPKASPIQYLERWHLHNLLFGDDVTFLGILERNGAIRMVIRQSAIAGVPATLDQIDEFFVQNDWKRFTVDGDAAYFDPERNVVISDTHRGNLILMDDGLLAPIDLRVQALSGSLLSAVASLCKID